MGAVGSEHCFFRLSERQFTQSAIGIRTKSIIQKNYLSQDDTLTGGVACSPQVWASEKISGSSLSYSEGTRSSSISNGASVSAQTSSFARNREVLSSSIPYGSPRPPNFVVNYEYWGPLSGLQTPYQDNGPPVVPISGSYVLRAFTSNLSDAIVLEMQGTSQSTKVRDLVLSTGYGATPPPYVADASPLGELFFATSDLRVVIHDPRPNGIKQWVKPANVVRILGAVWM